MIFRLLRMSPCREIGSSSLGLDGGCFMPMNTNSSSRMIRACFIVLNLRESKAGDGEGAFLVVR